MDERLQRLQHLLARDLEVINGLRRITPSAVYDDISERYVDVMERIDNGETYETLREEFTADRNDTRSGTLYARLMEATDKETE